MERTIVEWVYRVWFGLAVIIGIGLIGWVGWQVQSYENKKKKEG